MSYSKSVVEGVTERAKALRDLSGELPSNVATLSKTQWVAVAGSLILAYAVTKAIYNAFFHPLAKYPGPKLAAVSGIWTAYQSSFTGRWPWITEDVIKKYGDVVRIGPNELVFVEPKSFLDIHGPKRDLAQTFRKPRVVQGFGGADDGLLWETDPEVHRGISKLMATSFSGKSIRDKEPVMNKHIDFLMGKIREFGRAEEGMDIGKWIEWLGMDLSVDLVFGWELNLLREMKTNRFLHNFLAADKLGMVLQFIRTYPIFTPLAFVVVRWEIMLSLARLINQLSEQILKRIEARGNLKHSDYIETLLPADKPAPDTRPEIRHMVTVAGQLTLGGFDPTSTLYYMTFFFLLKDRSCLEELTKEIREKFGRYEDMTGDSLRETPYLNACMQETLRLNPTAIHHSLPRISPGGMVNGHYIPKGVTVRSALFAYMRDPRYFHDPLHFRPERWLPKTHPRYDPAFSADDHSSYFPFITGPRQCPGREAARTSARLFLSKMLWLYDVEQLSGQNLDYDKDFTIYTMWSKPELRVRFLPVNSM